MIAGRSTRFSLSRTTNPCICPVRPIPLSSLASVFACARHCGTARAVAAHQSSGSCSAHPSCGEVKFACSAVAAPITRPSPSITTARVPPVPISMPRSFIHFDLALEFSHSEGDGNMVTRIFQSLVRLRRRFDAIAVPRTDKSNVKRSFFEHALEFAHAIANAQSLCGLVPFDRNSCLRPFFVVVVVVLVLVEGE